MNQPTAAADLRERMAALAALEEYVGDSCGNASHNIRNVLDGSYDPRSDADRYGLDYRQPADKLTTSTEETP